MKKALIMNLSSENACKDISENMLEILVRDFNRHHSNECQNLTICDQVRLLASLLKTFIILGEI